MAGIVKPPLYRIFVGQFLVLMPVISALFFFDKRWALAALAGATIQIIPNAYFALLAFRYSGARSSVLIAQSFYRGEVGKYVMTLVGFAALFSVFGADLTGMCGAIVFLAYASMLIVQWCLTPWVLRSRR